MKLHTVIAFKLSDTFKPRKCFKINIYTILIKLFFFVPKIKKKEKTEKASVGTPPGDSQFSSASVLRLWVDN